MFHSPEKKREKTEGNIILNNCIFLNCVMRLFYINILYKLSLLLIKTIPISLLVGSRYDGIGNIINGPVRTIFKSAFVISELARNNCFHRIFLCGRASANLCKKKNMQ